MYLEYQGSLLQNFLTKHGYVECYDEEMKGTFEANLTTFGEFRKEDDGGRTTRANIPFMEPPSPPKYIRPENLSNEIQDHINIVLSKYQNEEEEAKSILRQLIQPFLEVMSNLPGGVHNCGEKTLLAMVKKLELDPLKSVLLECGSGAPLLGLQASIFTKHTICLDLHEVMQTVYSIMENMSEDSSFMQTIHMIAGMVIYLDFSHPFRLGDILEIRPQAFTRINRDLGYQGDQSILDEVTHVTAFIGIDNG